MFISLLDDLSGEKEDEIIVAADRSYFLLFVLVLFRAVYVDLVVPFLDDFYSIFVEFRS